METQESGIWRIGSSERRGWIQYSPADGSRASEESLEADDTEMCIRQRGNLELQRTGKAFAILLKRRFTLRVSLVILLKEMDRNHCVPGNARMKGVLSSHPYMSFSTLGLCLLPAKGPGLVPENKFVWNLEFHLSLHFGGLNYQTLKGIDKSNLLG